MRAYSLQKPVFTPLRPVVASSAPERLPETVWLGVCFLQISLQAHAAPLDQAFALFEQHGGKRQIYQANALAAAQGLTAGMALNAAYALCQGLKVAMRDPHVEVMYLRRYAQSATAFTPSVALSHPDTLLLEVRHSLRLFGGLKALHRQLSLAFDVPHLIACAPVADAAELMARNNIAKVVRVPGRLKAALGDIDIASLPIAEKQVLQLSRCGLHMLKDLWRLPRHDLARRFGPDLIQLLDQLCGERIQPRAIFVPKQRFSAKHVFEQETDNIEHVLQAAEYLLKQAQQFLQMRASLCEKITFYLGYADCRRAVRHGVSIKVYAQRGGNAPRHFLPQFRERLQRIQLERAVDQLTLRIDHIRPCHNDTSDLFRRRNQSRESWQDLLDILFARLGKKRVYHIDLKSDHRPEYAWQKNVTWHAVKTSSKEMNRLVRPVWLFNKPVKCWPRHFDLLSDAERLEAGWWAQQDVRREYYQASDASGRRCWLFRDLQDAHQSWYLHGLFA